MADFNFHDAFGDAGNAVSDIFSAIGAQQSAKSYRTAAKFSDRNAQLAEYATDVQLTQARREAYLGIGREIAGVSASGFTQSGSALDLVRSANQQASLQQSALQLQGAINVNSYKQQAEAERDQAKSADAASFGNMIGGVLSGISAIAPLLLLL